jgi:hypothetical protein
MRFCALESGAHHEDDGWYVVANLVTKREGSRRRWIRELRLGWGASPRDSFAPIGSAVSAVRGCGVDGGDGKAGGGFSTMNWKLEPSSAMAVATTVGGAAVRDMSQRGAEWQQNAHALLGSP